MSSGEPTKNYVYQPLPANLRSKDPKIYAVAGPDVPFQYQPKGFYGLTESQARKIADDLNEMFERN